MALTDSKSPLELAAKPASITSTFSRSSWRAMRSFSSLVMDAPGDCSPSRKVVSKMIRRSLISVLRFATQVWQTKTHSPKTNGPLQVQTGRWCESLARYRICPFRTPSSSSEATWNMQCNVSQRPGRPIGNGDRDDRSVVQAALVGFVGRGADDARGPALGFAPKVDAIAREPVDHEQQEQHRGRMDVDDRN